MRILGTYRSCVVAILSTGNTQCGQYQDLFEPHYRSMLPQKIFEEGDATYLAVPHAIEADARSSMAAMEVPGGAKNVNVRKRVACL